MTDTTVSVNKDALKVNVSQYGWTSVEVARVDLLSDYLNQAFALLQEVKDFQGEYENFFDIYDQVTAMYNEITVKIADFNTKYPEVVRLHGEVVRLHREVQNNATAVSNNAIRVAADTSKVTTLSEEVQVNHDKVVEDAAEVARLYADMIDIVEELKKGNVYRGTWNPHSGAYPTNHAGTNSTWDVVLNAGESEFTILGHTWYWGDRLTYLAADGTYTQIETGSSVLSVNGLTGAVRLDMADIYRNTSGNEKLSIEGGAGAVMVTDGPTITDLNTKIEGIVGGAVISATPPVDPKEGVTWFCTEDARTYIWYKDEDNTVQWVDQNPDRIIIENIGGVPLLSVMWFPNRATIASGYIPADGQLVTKNLYPEAWDKVNTGIVPTVPDASWIADPLNRGAYTTGTLTQFRVPDYNGRSPGSAGAPFQRGDGTGINSGRITESQNKAHTHTRGDMNITGNLHTTRYHTKYNYVTPGTNVPKGAFTGMVEDGVDSTLDAPIGGSVPSQAVQFDASASWIGKTSSNGGDEARPLNVTGVWALKVYDRLIDPSSIDVNQVATELANVKAELSNYQGAGVAVGTVQWFAAEEVPFGYLMCDGRQVSRTTYPDLYKVIGDIYGPNDGISTFRLPDLVNEFIRGYSPASRAVGTKQGDAIRNIKGNTYHSVVNIGGLTDLKPDGPFGAVTQVSGTTLGSGGHWVVNYYNTLTFDASLTVPTAEENRPRNISMLPMIKAYGHIIDSGALDTADIELRVQNMEGHWENSREICLVNSIGTGHPHELVSADLPANIVTNTRYLIQNPFGKNTPVIAIAEILINGAWCDPQFGMADQNSGYGVKASYKQEEGIILQTGDAPLSLIVQNGQCGTGHNSPPPTPTAPCRIRVIKTV